MPETPCQHHYGDNLPVPLMTFWLDHVPALELRLKSAGPNRREDSAVSICPNRIDPAGRRIHPKRYRERCRRRHESVFRPLGNSGKRSACERPERLVRNSSLLDSMLARGERRKASCLNIRSSELISSRTCVTNCKGIDHVVSHREADATYRAVRGCAGASPND